MERGGVYVFGVFAEALGRAGANFQQKIMRLQNVRVAERLREFNNKSYYQCENRERIGNRDADEHGRLYLSRRLRIAADSFERSTYQDTEANARTDNTEAHRKRHTEGLCYFNIHSDQLLLIE